MFENLQAIAQWFEKFSCDTNNELEFDKDKGYSFLECNDICLLSKLPDVKNKTLLDRAHKRLKKIKDPFAKKNFLLAIINEFLQDGRKVIALQMLTNEIDNQTELFKLFRSDLLLHRVLCYLKMDKPNEALFDLYMVLENKIENLDRIHKQVMEEIKKYIYKHELTDQDMIITTEHYQITFEQILKQYAKQIAQFCIEYENNLHTTINNNNHSQQGQEQQLCSMHFTDNNGFNVNNIGQHENQKQQQNHNPIWNQPALITITTKSTPRSQQQCKTNSTYKSRFIINKNNNNNNNILAKLIKNGPYTNNNDHVATGSDHGQQQSYQHGPMDMQCTNNNNKNMSTSAEFSITYTTDNGKTKICVKQILNEPIIDNIFKLRAILVDNLCDDYQMSTIYGIFGTFGTIQNIKQRDNSRKLIIEYDNIESPRYCISYLSQVELPSVSQPKRYLEFRFYKSENQNYIRICKQNQIKTSKECYFWRTTGCLNNNCPFYHNRLAKGVDYQEWMRIESIPINDNCLSSSSSSVTRVFTNKTKMTIAGNKQRKQPNNNNKKTTPDIADPSNRPWGQLFA